MTTLAQRRRRTALRGVFRVVAAFAIALHLLALSSGATDAERPMPQEFVGSAPCDPVSRDFVGGLAANVPCHCITWRITLIPGEQTNKPGRYKLKATYGLAGRADPNQLEVGPTIESEGEWQIQKGSAANPKAVVYHLKAENGKALSLLRFGEHLLHFLDQDHALRVGNAGWSYTLNRKKQEQPR